MAPPGQTAGGRTGASSYRLLVARRIGVVLGLALLLILSVGVDISLGPARYGLSDVFSTVLWPGAADLQMRVVVWDIRMPMALMAVTVGGSLSLAQTLVSRPKVILMDEPTSALDLYRQYEVLDVLQSYVAETDAVAILALHDLNQVLRSCPTTIAVHQEQIEAFGPIPEVLCPETIHRLYGINTRIETCSLGHPVMIVDYKRAA